MQHRRIYLIAGAIAVVIVAGFALSAPHLHDAALLKMASSTATATPVVYLHDVYKKGTHTITGKVVVADPCVVLSSNVSVAPALASSSPSTILVALEAEPDVGICLEQPATTTFTLTASAAGNALLTTTFNGTDASTSTY